MAKDIKQLYEEFSIPQNVIERTERFANTIKETAKVDNNMSVLDFGCEKGLVGLNIIQKAKKVTFLDPHKEAIDNVKKHLEFLELKNYELVNKPIEKYEGEKFDLIFASICLHHVEDYKGALAKMHSLLNPNGQLIIIEIYTGVIPDSVPIPHHGLEPKVLVEAVTEKGFADAKWEDYGHFEHLNQQVPIYLVTAHV